MASIIDFLEARIAGDEKVATYVRQYGDTGSNPLFSPARVLAECAAKRALVQSSLLDTCGCSPVEDFVLETLAAVYKDHPDYRQEWASA